MGGKKRSIKLGELRNIKARIVFNFTGLSLISMMIISYIGVRVFILPDKITFLDFLMLCVFAMASLMMAVAQIHFLRQLITRSGKRIEDMTYTDELTGIGNRRHVARFLDEEFAEAELASHPLSVLFIDLNKFKQINDQLGHAAGDAVLREFAKVLRGSTRDTDFVGRAGGDEFVVILPGTSAEFATVVARRITEKAALAKIAHESGAIDGISASIGISEFPKNAASRNALIEDADRTMYAAKFAGVKFLLSDSQPDSAPEQAERGHVTTLSDTIKNVVESAPAVKGCSNA